MDKLAVKPDHRKISSSQKSILLILVTGFLAIIATGCTRDTTTIVVVVTPTPAPVLTPTQSPGPFPTQPPPSVDCTLARITSPRGTYDRNQAGNFPVSNDVAVAWEPSGCVLTVQYYQHNVLRREYRSVTSGTVLNIGAPGSGETEIKIWAPPSQGGQLADNTWVWVR